MKDAPTQSMHAFNRLRLRTKRLLLRPLRAADARALLRIFSDAEVMRFWSSPPWQSIDQAHAAIARDRVAMAAGEYMRLGLERAEDKALIGTCTLLNLSEQSRRAEIGYALDARLWGRGYMHEALLALLEFAFSGLDLNRVEADINPLNAASARCLERLGFAREGLLRERWIVDGIVSDSAIYGLIRSTWKPGPPRD